MSVKMVSRLGKIAEGSVPKAAAAVQKTTFAIAQDAQTSAPVDTGKLWASVQPEIVAPLTGVVKVGAEYGHYVEFGTTKMAAQPYLIPAAEQNRAMFMAAMRGVFQ